MRRTKILSLLLLLSIGLTLMAADKISTSLALKNSDVSELTDSALLYYNQYDFQKAVITQQAALEKTMLTGDSSAMAHALHRMGRYYCGWDKYKIGIEYYFRALEIFSKTGDTLWMANEYNDIGFAYLYWEDYVNVLKYYHKALLLYRQLKIPGEIALVEANIGFALCFSGKQDSAIAHHRKSLAIYKSLHDSLNYRKMYHALGDAEQRRGNFIQALAYLDTAINFGLIFNSQFEVASTMLVRAQTLTGLHRFKAAEEELRKCRPAIEQRNSAKWMKNYFETLYELRLIQHKYSDALTAFRKLKNIEDSTFNKRLRSEILEMQIINETREKQQQIDLLEARNLLANKTIKFNRRTIIGSGIVILITSSLLIIIYLLYRQRNRSYRKLFERNRQLVLRENRYIEKLKKAQESESRTISPPTLPNELNIPEKERLIEQLEKLLAIKKAFLNSNLKLNDLCKKLNTNSAYLSQIINTHYGKNFNVFINEYRIREAQRCFMNGDHIYMSIEGIAQKVGFKTRATFNAAFRKITGVTPTFYIETLAGESTPDNNSNN